MKVTSKISELAELYKQIWIKSKNVEFHNFTVKLFNFVWIYEPIV